MLLRRVARPLLAATFISGGVDTLLNPEPKIAAATPLLEDGQESLPTDGYADPATLVQVDAAVKVIAGALLALGWVPRIAATALAASLIPTTVAGHAFWEEGGGERQDQQTHFLKNAGLLGGLLLAAADTEGRPSLAWRARRAARAADKATRAAAKGASSTVEGTTS